MNNLISVINTYIRRIQRSKHQIRHQYQDTEKINPQLKHTYIIQDNSSFKKR